MTQTDHLIIGGGLAGTTIAVTLHEKGKEFLLIESGSRLGGKIQTQLTDEACFELGPNSFSNTPDAIFKLLEMLGMRGEVLEPASAASKRYILKNGKIVALPGKPPEIFTTKALSLFGKLRFMREFFYLPKRQVSDESVYQFFKRHFGSEIADYFADPFVSGIFAGDPKNLSLKEAFPTMIDAEEKGGSLLRYLIRQRKTAKTSPQIHQMKRGLESIFHRAEKKIGPKKIHLSESVIEVVPEGEGMKVITDQGEYLTKKLFMTLPAYRAADCLKKGFPKVSQSLAKINYAPVISVHLKISRQESYPFDGFGILIPSKEKRKLLGVLWNSSAFPVLFPDKSHHYLTVYIGGIRHPEMIEKDDEAIKKIVCEEVQSLFSLKQVPTFIQMSRHRQAIPQYDLEYGPLVRSLQENLIRTPALKLAGNYLGGISIPKTVGAAMEGTLD